MDNKKTVRTDPGEKPIVFWTFDTPYGVGIRSNGLLAGFLTSNGANSITDFNLCQIGLIAAKTGYGLIVIGKHIGLLFAVFQHGRI